MEHKRNAIIFALALSLLSGCNNFVQDYVAGTKPENIANPTPESISSPMSLQMTPEKMNAAGGGMVVQGTISVTNRSFALGGDRALSLTINRSRVQPK
jgi:hypothetical protein